MRKVLLQRRNHRLERRGGAPLADLDAGKAGRVGRVADGVEQRQREHPLVTERCSVLGVHRVDRPRQPRRQPVARTTADQNTKMQPEPGRRWGGATHRCLQTALRCSTAALSLAQASRQNVNSVTRSFGSELRREESWKWSQRTSTAAPATVGSGPVNNDIAVVLRRMQPRCQRYRGSLRPAASKAHACSSFSLACSRLLVDSSCQTQTQPLLESFPADRGRSWG